MVLGRGFRVCVLALFNVKIAGRTQWGDLRLDNHFLEAIYALAITAIAAVCRIVWTRAEDAETLASQAATAQKYMEKELNAVVAEMNNLRRIPERMAVLEANSNTQKELLIKMDRKLDKVQAHLLRNPSDESDQE